MSQIIYIANARISFPHLTEPHAFEEGGAKKYSCDLILPPNDPGFAEFWQTVNAMANEKWAEHAAQILKLASADRKLRCYGQGEEKINKQTMEVYAGYPGNVFISANNAKMPAAIGADGKPIDPENTLAVQAAFGKCYGGAYVEAAIRPWLQDNKFGRGVRCALEAVRFKADGEAFGEGAPNLDDVFKPVAGAPAPLSGEDAPATPAAQAPAGNAMPWDA